jgi:hypothetical protein
MTIPAERRTVNRSCTFYLRRASDLIELRQARYRKTLEDGAEHPRDLCALAFSKGQMRQICATHNLGPVDWDSLPEK